MRLIEPLRATKRVYCAGPLFNQAERDEMLAIAGVLDRAGFEPFMPHADGMEFSRVLPVLVSWGTGAAAAGQMLHAAIFALDVYQVAVGCGSLVFNCNGRVPDEGAVAEAAIAWTLGKPVVIYKEDARSAIAGRDNPLLVGLTRFRTIREIDRIGRALVDTIRTHPIPADWKAACPPHLADTIDAGEALWRRLESVDPKSDAPGVAAIVLERFGRAETAERESQ